jgi:hypothetical protein
MKDYINNKWGWLSVILMVTSLSFSLVGKAESDAEKELGPPAGTAGHNQNQDPEKRLGTRGHHVPDKTERSTAEQELRQPDKAAEHEQNEAPKKHLGTRGLR